MPNAKGQKSSATKHPKKNHKTRATTDNTIEITNVDINGKGYSFPNNLNVTSPGIRPTPIFLSQGQQADKTATAMNVVNSQRIIPTPRTDRKKSKRMRPVTTRKNRQRLIEPA